jgi:hypothetical protein
MKLVNENQQKWYCHKDDQIWFNKEQRWQGKFYTDEFSYEAFYVDGYRNVASNTASLSLLRNFIKVEVRDSALLEPTATAPLAAFEIPYLSLEMVNVTHEREITALRTALVGSVFAALFKKEDQFLNIGFRDENGLLQISCFKIARGQIPNCYENIIRKLRRAKGLPDIENATTDI